MINVEGINYKIETLEIINLNYDIKNYQRETSEIKIKTITRNFDWNAFGLIFVNIRENGKYYVVDGQHRIVSATRKGFKKVPCMVYKGLTVEQEAKLFVYYQTNRTVVRIFEKYQALLTAGDEKTRDIQQILEKYKLIPNGSRGDISAKKKGYVNAVGAFYKIYKGKNGKNWFETVIRIITSIWGYKDNTFDPDALNGNMFLGMNMFLVKAYKNIDEKKFIAKMQKIPAQKITNIAIRNMAIFGKGKASNTAKAILEMYNNNNTRKLQINF